MAEKVHDLSSDAIRIMLTNVAPSLSLDSSFSTLTDIAATGGYIAGGFTTTVVSSSQTGGIYTLIVNPITLTASAGIGPFRWTVMYNDTSPLKSLIAMYDNGVSVSLVNGQSLVLNFNLTLGVIKII